MLSASERMAKQREAKAALEAEREAKRIEREHKKKFQSRQKSYSGNSMILSETIHDVMIKDAINLLQNIIKTTTESQP